MTQTDIKIGIVPKIDTFTAIFENTTFSSVMNCFGMHPDLYVSEFLKHTTVFGFGCQYWFGFSFEGFSLTSTNLLLDGSEDENVFEKVLATIRVNISGQGLDFLRSIGYDIEDHCIPDEWIDFLTGEVMNFHITRCDFTFDLINYKPEFLDKCIEHCREHRTESDRIALLHGSNLRYSYRLGDQKTLYLGSPRSDKLLRIYDKRLEYIDRKTKLYIKDNPYNSPDSWIRVEWQTRNKFAHAIFFATDKEGNYFDTVQFISVLRTLYDNYCFSDMNSKYWDRQPAKFWQELYDWDLIPRIIYNNKFVVVKPFFIRVTNYVEQTALTNFMLYISMYGQTHLLEKCREQVELFNNVDKIEDVCYRELIYRRKRALLNKMNVIAAEHGLHFGLQVIDGKLTFSEV